jgi:hypothetical protein
MRRNSGQSAAISVQDSMASLDQEQRRREEKRSPPPQVGYGRLLERFTLRMPARVGARAPMQIAILDTSPGRLANPFRSDGP